METYSDIIQFLFSQLPAFQRIGAAAYKADLNNTLQLSKLLDFPERKFKTIHIAGTNGKGSTSHMLASVFQEAGFKTGLYTSPHLKDFRERIRINGKMIEEGDVIKFVTDYSKDFIPIKPSFFEITVAMAFDYFAKNKVDIAIIETGMGGRLDSTNIIQPLLSIITNIGFDHVMFLGNTLKQIAFEKAGIIKTKTPVVIGEYHEETFAVFQKKAIEMEAPIYFADKEFDITNPFLNLKESEITMDVSCKNNVIYKNLKSDLFGNYQFKNIITVIQSLKLIKDEFGLCEKYIRSGLANVKTNTGLQGRWQILSHSPLTICDTGHNVDGLKMVLEQIEHTPHSQLHFVIGMVNDKDVSGILALLPKNARYYFCKADIPRGLPAEELANAAIKLNLVGEVYPSVTHAMKAAQLKAQSDDLVFVGGSTFVVAEVV